MKKSDFYFDLPEELIAQTPLEKRDSSRLMCLDRVTGEVSHRVFTDLEELLRPGDCLVMNDSRVLPARLLGARESGGAVEVLLLRDLGEGRWECLTRPGRKTKPGVKLSFGSGELTAEVESVAEGGNRIIRFNYEGIFLEVLERLGKMPLPPYIKEELQDAERYQDRVLPRARLRRRPHGRTALHAGIAGPHLRQGPCASASSRCTSAWAPSAPSRRTR